MLDKPHWICHAHLPGVMAFLSAMAEMRGSAREAGEPEDKPKKGRQVRPQPKLHASTGVRSALLRGKRCA